MSPAQEMRQIVGLAEKACGKYANIRTISVAVSKPWYRAGWFVASFRRATERIAWRVWVFVRVRNGYEHSPCCFRPVGSFFLSCGCTSVVRRLC